MVRPLFRQALLMAVCCLTLLACSHAQSVALTFDDLPETGDVPPGMTRAGIGRALAKQLKQAGAPEVYGFLNAGTLDDPDVRHVLERWRQAGFLLGNHTYTHKNLDRTPVPAYERDILRDEPVLRWLMQGRDWHWYRFPYLAEGSTPARREAIRGFLHEHGYRIAEVTIDSDDYAYNEPYARCLLKRDTQSVDRLKALYLQSAREHLRLARTRSQMLFGRDIAHVMLLHFNGFEAVMLPGLLDLLKAENFQLVSLEQAESDPVYALDPQATNEGATFLEDLLQARHLDGPPDRSPTPASLDAMCR